MVAPGKCISKHTAGIYDRGGMRRLGQLVDISRVKWGRDMDEQGLATVVISGRKNCAAQAKTLLAINTRRHEIVIHRGLARSFEGPILEVNWYEDRVELICKDASTEYLRNTSISRKWTFQNEPDPLRAPMIGRVRAILNHELTVPYDMVVGQKIEPTKDEPGINTRRTVTVTRWEQQDPPANILPHMQIQDSPFLYTRSITEAFEMTVLDHLKDLSRNGLSFTAVGRRLLVWDSDFAIGTTRALTSADFVGNIRVVESGTDYRGVTHISATSEESDGQIGVGHAGEVDAYYGPWEHIYSSQSEEGSDAPTQNALNGQAERIRRGREVPPVQMIIPSSAGLRLSDDLTINQLVPGTVMPVKATFNLREVVQDQLLVNLVVEETAVNETISGTLVPAGPVRWAES
jgi:hypothetical protein